MQELIHRKIPMRELLVGDRFFYQRVLSIVVPIIIQSTVTNVVSLLDNVMVGRVGTLPMSAVAIVNQLLFIFNLCIFGGLAGAGIFSTQYAGAKDQNGIRYCFRIKLYLALAMLLIALAIFASIPEKLISLYLAEGTSPEETAATLEYGLGYLRWMLVGLLPFALTQAYGGTLREVGETSLQMVASIVAILLNLVFNYLLIFGKFGFPELGVVGAAIATVLARFVEAVIVVGYSHRHLKRFPFIRGLYASLKIPKELLLRVARRGSPLLCNEFLWSLGQAVLMQCYSVRGLDVVAAVNIAQTVGNLFNVVFLSMGNAVAIMVGQALGAGEVIEARKTAWRLIVFSIATCAVMSTLMAVLAPVVPLIYNTEDHVRHLATSILYVFAGMMPIYAFTHCAYFTLRSGGKTVVTFIFDSGYTWGISVPAAAVLAYATVLPIVPLYLLVQSLELIKGVIGFFMLKRGVWIQNIVADLRQDEGEAGQ